MGAKSITRRNFLKSCAAVGAAAMFATTSTLGGLVSKTFAICANTCWTLESVQHVPP